MNILWINHEYPPIGGGGGTTCRELSREFAAAGHNVTIVSAAFKDTPQFEEVDGVGIHRLKCKRSAKDQSSFLEMLSFLLAAFRFVSKLIKKNRYDVVYIFFGLPSGPLGWYIKRRFRIPYIICLGGGDIPGTQKRFTVAYALLSPVLKAVWKNADYVVANSQMLQVRAMRFYSKANFTVINNGVNLRNYPAEKTYRPEGIFKIATAARIIERKGIQHVINTLPRLIKETNGNIKYTIIGDGPYRKDIEALADKLAVSEYIEITGMMPYNDYLEMLTDADVFVLVSYWEGMPNVVTEAMASHLPIIMSDCEGSAELVDDNGYIIKRGDKIVDDLTEKLLMLYNDRELAADLGNKSYKRVRERFIWHKSAAGFLALAERTSSILWINHEYPPIGGGGATACRALSREVAALGYNVTVVSAGYKNTPSFETVDGVDIYRLKCKRSSKDQSSFFEMLSYLFAAFRFVSKHMKNNRFDMVYVFFGLPSGPLGWYIKKRYKVPYIVRLGGGDIPGTQRRFLVAYALLGPVLKAVWRNAEYVVANSQMLQERAMRYYDKARFTVINSGINLQEFPAGKKYREQGKLHIITTARIVQRKGIQHVIEALPKLAEETNGNIHYTIVGDGPYRKDIEALAERLAVSKYIEITGMLSFEENLKRLSEADVFVLASHWEGMPNAVIEAMASHLPVIMSNCEGSTELVDGNGFIVGNNENIAAGLTEKILTLYNDRKMLAEMGEISYKRVCDYFMWEKSAAHLLKLTGIV